MQNEIVVLTGAAGCIGFHTLKLLLTNDDQVSEIRCLDIREPEESMKKSIADVQAKLEERSSARKLVKWIQGDIRDINTVERTLACADCVIHCASKIDVWTESSDQDGAELASINITGTENLLKAAVRLGVHKFIHVSSFEVYASLDTIYYATEATLPETKSHLFGASGQTKQVAEEKVRQYSNNKLQRQVREGKDSLNAIIVRFSSVYGEYDKYYVSKILEVTKFFGGKLRRLGNIWIRQQPIYAGNAAWGLVKAKKRMDVDQTISGEDFHLTDETPIGDPFDFAQPYVEGLGMQVTKTSYPFVGIWLLMILFFAALKMLRALDFAGVFTDKKNRVQEAIEKDLVRSGQKRAEEGEKRTRRWYEVLTPQTVAFMCISTFLNRTKASLRLDYEPLVEPDEALRRSLEWYRCNVKL